MLSRRDLLSTGLAIGTAAAWPRASGAAEHPKIKIGQIGVGHAHATKLEVYRRSSDYEVVGMVEPDAGLRGRAEQGSPEA